MRFSFIHAADLHIDSPLAGLGLKDKAVAERFAQAGRRAVEALIAETIRSQAAFLIVAGDIFDGDWRDVTTGLFFVRAIGALHRAGIPAIMVKGNHDSESGMSRSLTYPESVRIFSSRKAETFDLPDHRVALHGRSFPNRLVPDDFVESYPARRDGWLNIGVLHTSLEGSKDHQSYAPCSLADLRLFGYDYWALGHVHDAKILSEDPWVVYPGNLQGRSVRETGAKGAMRVTVEDGRIIAVEPLVFDGARWAHETVDVSGAENETDVIAGIGAALEALHGRSDGRPLAVRVTLSGTTPLHSHLVARREILQDEARAAGFRIAEDCWVEQLKLTTSAPQRAAAELSPADSLDVDDLLAAAAADPAFAEALAETMKSIIDKLPHDLRKELSDDPDRLKRLADDARDYLAGEMAS
ncbi:DNA repair exonuclease [Tardiphaga sp.]|uniref:metallophosphoesterase family protein n=1 Tax=Tardiphaga sp. TaxID=1926292 RepID=UPI00261334F5|nr:DNA repair exonuclease [Tardiphaga sp.]